MNIEHDFDDLPNRYYAKYQIELNQYTL